MKNSKTEAEPYRVDDEQSAPTERTVEIFVSADQVDIEPERISARSGDTVQWHLVNPPENFLSVEIHLPGNLHRQIAYRNGDELSDNVYLTEETRYTQRIRIGPKAETGGHNYKIYLHTRGSTNTTEAKTQSGRDPRIIIQ